MATASDDAGAAGVKIRLVVTLVCLVFFLGSGLLAVLCVHLSQPASSGNFAIPSPQMVLLTDQNVAKVTYSITYYQGSFTQPGGTDYTGPDSDMPVNTRSVRFSVHVSRAIKQLEFALLLNSDAVMTDPAAEQGVGYVDSTSPAGEIQSSCSSVQNFPTAQVLSGVVEVDSTGEADIDLVGGIPSYVRYPSNGDRTPVNVMEMLPAAGDVSHSGVSGCSANLINWEQVGGVAWRTPTYGSGQVTVGAVSAGRFIESANPPTIDAQNLSWNLQGPADVSYTLFDSDSQSSHELWLFWAGIAAGLSATLFVEFIKAGGETLRAIREHGRNSDHGFDAKQHAPVAPSHDGRSPSPRWPPFTTGLISGIIIGGYGRRLRRRQRVS